MTGKTRAGKDPSWIGPKLLEREVSLDDISKLYDRIITLLDAGEDVGDVLRRLNPRQATRTPDESWEAHRARLRASGDIPWDLKARVARERARLKV